MVEDFSHPQYLNQTLGLRLQLHFLHLTLNLPGSLRFTVVTLALISGSSSAIHPCPEKQVIRCYRPTESTDILKYSPEIQTQENKHDISMNWVEILLIHYSCQGANRDVFTEGCCSEEQKVTQNPVISV